MNIKLKYGSRDVKLTLPDKQVMGIYRPADKRAVRNLGAAVTQSLTNPIGSKRLSQIVQPDQKVVIVVDDATRFVPSAKLLVPIVRELNGAGIPDKNIRVITATGLHRKMKRLELDAVLGPLKGRIKITNHDNENNLKFLGKTSLGTRIYINKDFLEADIKILTGDAEYHQFCGYGGGAKSVFPGLGDTNGIRASHSKMEMTGVGPARIKDNPVREEIDEVGRMASVDFIINVVLNSRKKVAAVFSGDVEKAFLAATKVCDEIYSVQVPKRADVVIASAGGFPKDIELYQAQKAIEGARRIVKKGGKIILFAQCREGHGSKLAYQWAKEAKTAEDIIKRLRKKFVIGAHKAYQLAVTSQWADVYLYSAMKPQMVQEFFLKPLSSPRQVYSLIDKTDRIAILPQATLTLARLKGSQESKGFLK